jgi:hypothetical protein
MTNNRKATDGFKRESAEETELRRETRKQRAIERLGSNSPACVICGENDPLVLERHHVAGRAYDESAVIVCRNHHRILSDHQKDHPDKITEIPDYLETRAHLLFGLADFFELLVKIFRSFAAQLIELADPNRDNLEPPQ